MTKLINKHTERTRKPSWSKGDAWQQRVYVPYK